MDSRWGLSEAFAKHSLPAICWEFGRTGACKFGKRCRYRHPTTPIVPQQDLPPEVARFLKNSRLDHLQPNLDGKLREWKRLLGLGAPISRPSPAVVSHFFQLALELMEGDISSSQDVIKHLTSDKGLLFVKDVVERHLRVAAETGPSLSFWKTEVKPLFQLITHPRVVDSAVLENEVTTMFNYILGVGGLRMNKLFEYIVQMVKEWPDKTDNASQMPAVELSLAVLSKILDCNTTNIVNQNFATFTDQFSEIVHAGSEEQQTFACLQSSKYIDYIHQRLQVGDEIMPFQNKPNQPVAREEFVIRRDLPGMLSAEGPRHDNDFADMSMIRILPTREEIMSPRAEYLPTNDSTQWHIGGIRGRLDREFRLLREDTVGQLRDTVRDALEQIRNPYEKHMSARNGLRTYKYEDPIPLSVDLSRNDGIKLHLRCQQLPTVTGLSQKDREAWWSQSRRLQAGALVCVIEGSGSVQFFVVSQSTMRSRNDRNFSRKMDDKESNDKGPTNTLSDDPDFLYVWLQMVDCKGEAIEDLLLWYRAVDRNQRRYLVEFPGVLLDSFKHTLGALQQMYEKPNIPFSDILAPASNDGSQIAVQPAMYARNPTFSFDLGCIQKNLVISASEVTDPEELTSASTLDITQSAAVLNTLSRELSLIQGPPGTGKSYTGEKIIKILLENREKAKLGPIICVCYTNHALDQLLEHLLDEGVDKIIRIGSRSKSDRILNLNLHHIVKAFGKTKSEKIDLGKAEGGIKQVVRDCQNKLQHLAKSQSPRAIMAFIMDNYPCQYDELFPQAEEEWTLITHRKPEEAIHEWLRSGENNSLPPRPISELKESQLLNMSYAERQILFKHWLQEIRDPIVSAIVDLHKEYATHIEQRARVSGEVKLRCLQEADVIGLTTTGLAKNIKLLRRLRSKAMVCEEAGEVLEAHILTALLPSLEQAILIGDHLQLRPQINNYELQSTNPYGAQYSLDKSLFERLVKPPHETDNRVPFSTLETQRRMHPSIAELIRSTLYPQLKDSDSVTTYPDVVGMKKRLFWLHHDNLEAGAAAHDPLNTSHSNDFEVDMTTALVSHIVRQGEYHPGQIAVITPYLGQLHKLRQRMSSIFEICLTEGDQDELAAMDVLDMNLHTQAKAKLGKTTLMKAIRIATVDNFQGEEAEVVIISLVRSNPQNRCGFLSTTNRINVLLSRAKHGMYIIGNSNTYNDVPMWRDVIGTLDSAGNIGTSLQLQCPRHPDTPLMVSQPDDFVLMAPESGCNLPCRMRLRCGHTCSGRCHSDVLHNAVKCQEPCPRSFAECDHPCPRKCGDTCPVKCQFLTSDVDITLSCGHKVDEAPCWQVEDPMAIKCQEKVMKTIPGCKHECLIECSEDVSGRDYVCSAVCGAHLPCGHECKEQCQHCSTRKNGTVTQTNHGICNQVCGRNYPTCRHSCSKICHDGKDCPPCEKPCEVRCSHSQCSKPCHEPCAPCAEEKCPSRCPHAECSMPCCVPCDWVPCSRRCEETLACGHQCPSLCSEPCPDTKYCQLCAPEDIKSACVDFLEMKEYRDINLDENPCIFPNCGHFLTLASMDGQMDMALHYEIDDNGLPIRIRKQSEPFSMDDSAVRVCASCRGSLHNVARYGRVVRRVILDEATKKFITWSNARYLAFASKLPGYLERIESSPALDPAPLIASAQRLQPPRSRYDYLDFLEAGVVRSRYLNLLRCWVEVRRFANEVKAKEQPFRRVADLVKHANRLHKTQKEFRFDETAIQVKGYLLACTLLLKCELSILNDFFIRCKGSTRIPAEYIPDFTEQFKDCEEVIQIAQKSVHRKEEVQAIIFEAQLCAISAITGSPSQPPGLESPAVSSPDTMRRHGFALLEKARGMMERYPSTDIFSEEIHSVEMTLMDSTYQPVTASEMRAVINALAGEIRGSGSWYTCANGHPFAVGECGMPMERARCPECDAAIGGQDHELADGVTSALEIAELVRDVNELEI